MGALAVDYAKIVEAHAKRAMLLYKKNQDDLCRLAGFRIAADGTNNARSKEDVLRYLKALEAVAGMVAVSSATLTMKQAARANGINDLF